MPEMKVERPTNNLEQKWESKKSAEELEAIERLRDESSQLLRKIEPTPPPITKGSKEQILIDTLFNGLNY